MFTLSVATFLSLILVLCILFASIGTGFKSHACFATNSFLSALFNLLVVIIAGTVPLLLSFWKRRQPRYAMPR